MSGSSLAIGIQKVSGGKRDAVEDHVAVEEPLEIQLNASTAADAAARSISITMRTPGHDTELALGFLVSEGLIKSARQIAAAGHVGPTNATSGLQNIVRIELSPDTPVDLGQLQRHFYTTSSCGVCGKSSIDALRVTGCESLQDKGESYRRQRILQLPGKLLDQQRLFSQTGGLHAAAIFDRQGDVSVTHEDVGRHNAVDKVIGTLLREDRLPANELGLLVSGRASFELVQKALVAGIPTLVAVSAPSSLAIALAREYGMTLVGFLRGDTFNIYSGESRIT